MAEIKVHSPRVNFYVSNAGFSVESLGRTGMLYREGEKTMLIESEVLGAEKPSIAIWKDRMQNWYSPYYDEIITEEKRLEILRNICAVLKSEGIEAQIHSKADGWVTGWIE